jgi:polysaccharide deacetylase 2 family uncharacterized protein YibQ
MEFKDYYIRKKSDIQIAKDDIMDNIMKQQGMYDMYFLGQISVVETLVNCIDKEYSIALLTGLTDSTKTSETIKKLAKDLIDKYSKEPKFEL